jgi:hypothetical protein
MKLNQERMIRDAKHETKSRKNDKGMQVVGRNGKRQVVHN